MYSSNNLRNIGTPENPRYCRERKMIVIVRKFRSGASNDTQPTDDIPREPNEFWGHGVL